MAKSHKDVEFVVDSKAKRKEQYFKYFNNAAGYAVMLALSGDTGVVIDVLISSRVGARWYGGDDAVDMYDTDPDASVFERLEIKVNNAGMIS